MEQQTSLAGLVEMWCREAVAIWGDDWPSISAHIDRRYAALDGETRRRLEGEAALVLAAADWPDTRTSH